MWILGPHGVPHYSLDLFKYEDLVRNIASCCVDLVSCAFPRTFPLFEGLMHDAVVRSWEECGWVLCITAPFRTWPVESVVHDGQHQWVVFVRQEGKRSLNLHSTPCSCIRIFTQFPWDGFVLSCWSADRAATLGKVGNPGFFAFRSILLCPVLWGLTPTGCPFPGSLEPVGSWKPL